MEAVQSVITGDLVASSEAGAQSVDRAMNVLSTAATNISAWRIADNSAVGDTRFTRFRGDGWQILISIEKYALRAALLMYARLAAEPGLPATRVAVGAGTVEHVPGPDLSDAHGAAFALSGRALAEMERGERLKIVGNCNPGYVTPLYAAFIGLLNDRITDWTPEQAEAVAHVIEPDSPTQSAIAATLGISPQALSSRLAGARWPTIRRLLQEWESPHSEGAPHD